MLGQSDALKSGSLIELAAGPPEELELDVRRHDMCEVLEVGSKDISQRTLRRVLAPTAGIDQDALAHRSDRTRYSFGLTPISQPRSVLSFSLWQGMLAPEF